VISGARILAVWLTPAAWLALPALVLEGGPDGVWTGLLLLVAPLLALSVSDGDARAAQPARDALFPVVIFLLVAGLLLSGSLVLAGDAAAWLGAPRWQGIGIAAGGAWLLVLWRSAARLVPWLVFAVLLGLAVSLVVLARGTGLGPLRAWERVASQPAFRFPASSPWVGAGRELRAGRGPGVLVFEEVHRITAAGPAQIHVRARDGARVSEATGSSGRAVGRPPSRRRAHVATGCAAARFEAGKAVPGAPPSGISWSDGRGADASRRWGLFLTLTGGALALVGFGTAGKVSRGEMGAVGAVLFAVFVWGIGWAVYCALGAPDIFLGGVALERLVRPPSLSVLRGASCCCSCRRPGSPASSPQACRSARGSAASTSRAEVEIGTISASGRPSSARRAGGFWPAGPWMLVVIALGIAASTLAPPCSCRRLPPGHPLGRTWARLVGLGIFGALALAGQWTGGGTGLDRTAAGLSAVVAAPAAPAVCGRPGAPCADGRWPPPLAVSGATSSAARWRPASESRRRFMRPSTCSTPRCPCTWSPSAGARPGRNALLGVHRRVDGPSARGRRVERPLRLRPVVLPGVAALALTLCAFAWVTSPRR
jgi:hypothetical protein